MVAAWLNQLYEEHKLVKEGWGLPWNFPVHLSPTLSSLLFKLFLGSRIRNKLKYILNKRTFFNILVVN